MSYELSFNEEPDFLSVNVTGTRTHKAAVALAWDVLSACKERTASKVLVDLQQMTGQLDRVDAYDLAAVEFPKIQKTGVLTKMAVVDLEDSMERLKFFETVAVNRGVNMKIFSSVEKAAAWLAKE